MQHLGVSSERRLSQTAIFYTVLRHQSCKLTLVCKNQTLSCTPERGYCKIIKLNNRLKPFKISELGYCTMAKKWPITLSNTEAVLMWQKHFHCQKMIDSFSFSTTSNVVKYIQFCNKSNLTKSEPCIFTYTGEQSGWGHQNHG